MYFNVCIEQQVLGEPVLLFELWPQSGGSGRRTRYVLSRSLDNWVNPLHQARKGAAREKKENECECRSQDWTSVSIVVDLSVLFE